jgi:hypothetical protein
VEWSGAAASGGERSGAERRGAERGGAERSGAERGGAERSGAGGGEKRAIFVRTTHSQANHCITTTAITFWHFACTSMHRLIARKTSLDKELNAKRAGATIR